MSEPARAATPRLPVPDLFSRQLAYLALRLALGLNFLMHGATRLPDLGGFASDLVDQFSETIRPDALVRVFATCRPFAEGTVGLLLLLGLLTRPALLAGAATMLRLVFGTSLQQNWGTLATQMQYVVYIALLLAFLPYNRWAPDDVRDARSGKAGY